MKVIIVGNSTSVLKNKQGEFVDNHDVVIRMGGYKIEGYEDFVGKKTTIWSNGVSTIKIWKYFNENTLNKNLWIILPEDHSTDCEYIKQWQKEKYSGRQFNQLIHNEKLDKLKSNNKVECIKNEYLQILSNELNITKYRNMSEGFLRPSLGICTAFMAFKKYNCHINLIGFDFFNTGWYWDKTHTYAIGKHIPLMEKIWLEKKKKNNIISVHD